MYKIILAIRYLVKRRISYFSVAAVALCVFVVLVVITVLSGLTAGFKRNVHHSVGDCIVGTKSLVGFGYYDEFIEILEKQEIVEAVSPVIRGYAIVKSADGASGSLYFDRTLQVMGVDGALHSRVTDFAQWLGYNKEDAGKAFEQSYDANLPGCIIGTALVFERDSDGDYIIPEEIPESKIDVSCVPLTAKGALAKAGTDVVSTKTFAFSDCANSGISIDWTSMYIPFEEAQMLCGMGSGRKRTSAIHIKFTPEVELDAGCAEVRQLWGDFAEAKGESPQANLLEKVKVYSWKTYNRHITAAVETERTMMMLVFGMIGIITVFIVFVVFYMIVSHKSKDIGILKSVGVSNAGVLTLFMGFGLLIGVLGSVIGAVGGWQFLVHINQIEDWLFRHFHFQLWNRAIFAIGDIPNKIEFEVLATIVLSAIAACLIGALIPSRQASKYEPAKILQVNQLYG